MASTPVTGGRRDFSLMGLAVVMVVAGLVLGGALQPAGQLAWQHSKPVRARLHILTRR